MDTHDKDIEIELPELESDIFQVFVHWLYERVVDPSMAADPGLDAGDIHFHQMATLSDCYYLGQKLGSPHFSNQVIDKLIALHVRADLKAEDKILLVRDIFERKPTSAILQKLMVDFWIWGASPVVGETAEDTPEKFCRDLSKALWVAVRVDGVRLFTRSTARAPYVEHKCKSYHEHAEEEKVPCG